MAAVQLNDIATSSRRAVNAHGAANHVLARRLLAKPRFHEPNCRLQVIFLKSGIRSPNHAVDVLGLHNVAHTRKECGIATGRNIQRTRVELLNLKT